MAGPLEGLRVLDATQMLAGPICGMRLGDLGADVVKIEPPGTGEWTRTHGFANAEINGHTTAQLGLNRNKRSVTINLKSPAGQSVLHDLVRHSDVFIQNFRVGTAERLGCGYEQLRVINPRLIYGQISGYGEEGPYRDRPGQDLIVQGYSGSMFSVGSSEWPPIPGALWAADAMTGYQLGMGILAALHAREKTGLGQKVSVNMLAVVMDCQSQELVTAFNLGIQPVRSRAPFAHAWVTAPYGTYRTRDGWINLAQAPVHVLGEALNNARLQQMTEWSDGMTYRDEIYQIVSEILPSKTTAEWLEIFDRYKLWAGPVYTYADLQNDRHVQATGMVISVEHPEAGTLRMPNVPIRMSETPASVRLPPPLLGQHTEEVLREWLHYDDERIHALREAGVI
ncbi:MAG: CoA transferase [Anaerolineae bacterium]|nr:CoA transferase [Anaerolineae bacterium]